MYVPLRVDPRFWFRPRADLDSRLKPSPSVQALKIVRDISKKHLQFIAEHEKKLILRMAPEDVHRAYTQLGLEPPGPGEDTRSESSDDTIEPYRTGDLLPITVVGLRSHHHQVAAVRAEAFATWQAMRDEYNSNQQHQATIANSPNWDIQDGSSFSDSGSWTTEETPWGEEHQDSLASSPSDSSSDCDEEWADDSVQWDFQGEDRWDSEADREKWSGQFPELPGSDSWPTQLPTPPPSDTYSSPSSPVLPESQIAPTTDLADRASSSDSSVSGDPVLSASEELLQVLNDKKILEAFRDGIVKRIKESRISKSEKDEVKAAEDKEHRNTRRERRKPRGPKRGDPRRSLRFCRSGALSPEQAEQHVLEKAQKAHFESHFQMTHQYEDDAGAVHAEPIATQGVPPENRYEWTTVKRKRTLRF